MATDSDLIDKREELKRRLAAGEYKTLVDVFLAATNHLIRKITRRSKPLPTWVITVILGIVLTLTTSTIAYIEGDFFVTHNFFERIVLRDELYILLQISGYVLTIGAVVLINHYIRRICVFWRDDVLDATESVASLRGFEDWLGMVCNHRLHLVVTIIGGILLVLFSIVSIFLPISFIRYASIFAITILAVIDSASLYLILMVILLSARLRQFDLTLFAADPASSELVSRLAAELGIFVYIVALLSAFAALVYAFVGVLFSLFGVAQALLVWLPIIIMFILNQTSLSSIIRRAKWKTLNEIQAKVEKLQMKENFEDKETMEAINRLMDYHDRVKASRNSALDFRAYLSFINSLLLPLVAFVLGNLDKVLSLFAKQP